MRKVVDQVLGPMDSVQWLRSIVVDLFGTEHPYFVLHLPENLDVLDDARAGKVGDFVVKPVFSVVKSNGHNLMRVPESIATLIVSEELRHALLTATCTGVEFEEAAAV